MNKEEFYATIKLISGEEIFAKVTPCEEETRTLLILDTPVTYETVNMRHMGVSAIKIEPWMNLGDDTSVIINMDKVITISEIKDKNIVGLYHRYLRDKDRDSNQTTINEEMGFLSSISDARVSLEKIFKGS
jgi:hypothetical protein|tara:strand:- start:6464 stop:6856 length:393 start_codon:yes stop_codon:yes gene_type:complete